MANKGIIKRAVFRGGVIVFAIGPFSQQFYVAYNGVIAYKGYDETRANEAFATLVPNGALVLRDGHGAAYWRTANGSLEV